MRSYTKYLVVAGALAALAAPSAAMASGPSETVQACQQSWQTLVRTDNTSFKNQGDCVSYAAKGGVLGISFPHLVIQKDSNGGDYITVPFTLGAQTSLYGVPGYPQETPITHDVRVTSDMVGGGQFWIGYKADPGFFLANQGTWHVDFHSGGTN